jgi:hypothetical protein
MTAYWVYGRVVESNLPLEDRLLRASGAPDLTFAFRRAQLSPVAQDEERLFDLPGRAPDGESPVSLHRWGDQLIVRFPPVSEFWIGAGRITCHAPRVEHDYLVKIQLLGTVLALWLELRGVRTLHASAVEVEGRAVAFMSPKGGGKTSLAAAFLRRGRPLLTEDLLALEPTDRAVIAAPGYPLLRMWPEQAQHFLDTWEDLEIVHPAYSKRWVTVGPDLGHFSAGSRSLACLYLLERRDSREEIEIAALPGSESLMQLVRNSFMVPLVDALGLRAERLNGLADVAGRVPVRRVAYPSGLPRLPDVCQAIEQDLAGLRGMPLMRSRPPQALSGSGKPPR